MAWLADFVVGDTNAAADVFVYDRKSKIVDKVSLNNKGEEAIGRPVTLNLDSLPYISANGRCVSFQNSSGFIGIYYVSSGAIEERAQLQDGSVQALAPTWRLVP